MANTPTVSMILSLQERRASTTGVRLLRFRDQRHAPPTLHERRSAGRGTQNAPLILWPFPTYPCPILKEKVEAVRHRSAIPPRANTHPASEVLFFDPLEEEVWAILAAKAAAHRSSTFEPELVPRTNPLSPGPNCQAFVLQQQQGVPSPDSEDRPTVQHIEDVSKENQYTPPMDLAAGPNANAPGFGNNKLTRQNYILRFNGLQEGIGKRECERKRID